VDSRGTVLIADDNEQIRRVVRLALEHAGYLVYEAANGAVADQLVTQFQPHLVVLDVFMPYISGLELLRQWRSRNLDMGVIVLTGFGDEDSVGNLLEAGADDHVPKPVQLRELVERVNAVLRRIHRPTADTQLIVVGDVRLDLNEHRVAVGELVVPLSKIEMALLRELMSSPDRVHASEDLLAKVWGAEYRRDSEILRTNIYRLRRKLKGARFLRSRPGVGYLVVSSSAGDP
jgi:DNA-binding response OmpR family regulator